MSDCHYVFISIIVKRQAAVINLPDLAKRKADGSSTASMLNKMRSLDPELHGYDADDEHVSAKSVASGVSSTNILSDSGGSDIQAYSRPVRELRQILPPINSPQLSKENIALLMQELESRAPQNSPRERQDELLPGGVATASEISHHAPDVITMLRDEQIIYTPERDGVPYPMSRATFERWADRQVQIMLAREAIAEAERGNEGCYSCC